MKWTRHGNYMESACGQYRIVNNGKPGGNKYVLYRRKEYAPGKFCHCQLLYVGNLKEAQERAIDSPRD